MLRNSQTKQYVCSCFALYPDTVLQEAHLDGTTLGPFYEVSAFPAGARKGGSAHSA